MGKPCSNNEIEKGRGGLERGKEMLWLGGWVARRMRPTVEADELVSERPQEGVRIRLRLPEPETTESSVLERESQGRGEVVHLPEEGPHLISR